MSDLDEKNMGVEGVKSPFQRPKSGSPRARRALSKDPGPVLLGAIVSEKKILKEKCFFPLSPLNRNNSAPIGPICMQKIWASRARRALSSDPGPVLVGVTVSEKKIVKGKCFFPLFSLNRYNSATIGPISTKKILAWRARRAISRYPGPVLVRAIVSEKKIVKEKCFFPLFPLNCYNSAPICPIWTKKIWAALSNDPSLVLLGAIVPDEKILKKKCFFPLFPLNCHNSAPIGPMCTQKIWAARRALSKDPGPVLLGAIVSEKKILKEKCFFPLSPLNRNNSAPIDPICMQKIWA
ncbi:LOW QUALITY PROTEIN: hypothetical protein V1477_006264 [Vespula maculifrons]|uniref:Uncharacterized protein n=1 Tax=Vespula maculifrons TaxID=7453 RepID=A0ABD2CL27_VESMC